MRPVNLVLSAFGPFAETVHLNLDSLGEKGLYLITGDTGAGKTTIFDGIIYALFGEASGNIRTADMLRSKYADAATPTYVELTFVFRNKKYIVRRNPEYMRPSKRGGAKETKELAKAELMMPDGTFISGISSVNKKINEIIGLNRNQFSQIAMIAQGDFMRLLLAGTKDRIEIFREIFNTRHFLDLQEKIKRDANDLYKRIADDRKSILQYIKDVECFEKSSFFYELENVKGDSGLGTLSQTIELISNIISEDKNELEKAEYQLDVCNKKIDKLNNSIGKITQINKMKIDYENALIIKENAKARFEIAKPKYGELRLHDEKRQELVLLIENTKKEIERYKELDALNKVLEDKKNEYARNQKNLAENNESLQEYQKSLEIYKNEAEQLYSVFADSEKIQAEKKSIEQLSSCIDGIIKRADTDLDYITEIINLKNVYKETLSDYDKEKEDYYSMEKSFFDEQAGIMAESLKENQPCPVCGSLNHPNLAKASKAAPTENDLREAKKRLDEKSNKCSELSSKLGTANGQSRNSHKVLLEEIIKLKEQWNIDIILFSLEDNLQIDEVLTQTNEIKEKLIIQNTAVNSKIIEIKLKEKEIKQQIERLDFLNKKIPACEKESAEIMELIQNKEKTIVLIAEQIKNTETNICEFKKNLQYENKQEAMNKIDSLQKEKKEIDVLYEFIKNEYETSKIELETAKNRVEDLKKHIENDFLSSKERENRSIDELNEGLMNIEKMRNCYQDEKKHIDVRIANNSKILKAVTQIYEKIQNTENHYGWMKILSDTVAGGIAGKNRIMLETYVQMAFFDRIIMRANTRFMAMTSGQYELKRSEQLDNHKNQIGLELDIIDHYNGTIRSVKSLSGGESFKASLSMALGMSDEIQCQSGGIQIDTMFIDEGFGSLDEESLSQAVNVLNGLSESNRLVGIISHVSVLKERIDHQIVVEKSRTGGSYAEIHI